MDAVEWDRREDRGPPRLEAAGQVARCEPQDRLREEAATARDQTPPEPPIDDAAARGVAGTDDEIGVVVDDRPDQRRQRGRVVRPIGVHLDDDGGATL